MRKGHASEMRSASCATLIAALALAAVGCGGRSHAAGSQTATSVPAYVREPFTHQQQLIAAGGRLIVTYGCAACHLAHGASASAPSFQSFAGHQVRLADGRTVLVDEPFLRKAIVDPAAFPLAGYSERAMLAAVARLGLARRPQQVAELAAFIEEVGPEPQ